MRDVRPRHKNETFQSRGNQTHIPAKYQHVRALYRDLAAGADFHPDDLDGLRLDTAAMPSKAAKEVGQLTRQAAKEIAALHEGGHFQEARLKADEVAAKVIELAGNGEHILPERRPDDWPDNPREAADRVRRRP